MSIENRAKIDATRMHASINQERKFQPGVPYITHPAEVVRIASQSRLVTPHGKAAGWLHDVVEDVFMKHPKNPRPRAEGIEWVRARHGDRVAQIVDWLTDLEHPEGMKREDRKAANREHNAQADAEGQTLKVSDLIHNTHSIVRYDPNFARVYLHEKRLLLPMLTKADRVLWNLAWELAHQKI